MRHGINRQFDLHIAQISSSYGPIGSATTIGLVIGPQSILSNLMVRKFRRLLSSGVHNFTSDRDKRIYGVSSSTIQEVDHCGVHWMHKPRRCDRLSDTYYGP
jgi:hypothetical protein